MVANGGLYRSRSSWQGGGRSGRRCRRPARVATSRVDSLDEDVEEDTAKLLRCSAWRGEAQNGGDASATARLGFGARKGERAGRGARAGEQSRGAGVVLFLSSSQRRGEAQERGVRAGDAREDDNGDAHGLLEKTMTLLPITPWTSFSFYI